MLVKNNPLRENAAAMLPYGVKFHSYPGKKNTFYQIDSSQ